MSLVTWQLGPLLQRAPQQNKGQQHQGLLRRTVGQPWEERGDRQAGHAGLSSLVRSHDSQVTSHRSCGPSARSPDSDPVTSYSDTATKAGVPYQAGQQGGHGADSERRHRAHPHQRVQIRGPPPEARPPVPQQLPPRAQHCRQGQRRLQRRRVQEVHPRGDRYTEADRKCAACPTRQLAASAQATTKRRPAGVHRR